MIKEQEIIAVLRYHYPISVDGSIRYDPGAIAALAARERKARTKGILLGVFGTLIVLGSFLATIWANDQPAIVPSLQGVDSVLSDTLVIPNHVEREKVDPVIQREYDSLVKGRDSL